MTTSSAAVAARPIDSAKAEQHSLGWSIFLHLFPGLVVTIVYALLAAPLMNLGFPNFLTFNLLALFVLAPIEMAILYSEGKRKNGRFILTGVVLNRENLPIWQILLWALAVFVWAAVVFVTVSPRIDPLLQRNLFSWLPVWFPFSLNFSAYSHSTATLTMLVSLISTVWIMPYIEELYFRGYLLPRISRLGVWAAVLNTALFVLYHFFSPWQFITRLIAVFPLVYVVQRKRNLYIGAVAHLSLNTISFLPTFLKVLGG
jgi:uncharacterized protein